MKLVKIHFDAYKSLLRKELELKADCIGFVGTNESGKSNILHAINILSGNAHLTYKDIPKMSKTSNPQLKFVFKLNPNEQKQVTKIIEEWINHNTLLTKELKIDEQIIYTIEFDKNTNMESRYFTIPYKNLESDILALKKDKLGADYKILYKGKLVDLDKALIIRKQDLDKDIDQNIWSNLASLEEEIAALHNDIETMAMLDATINPGDLPTNVIIKEDSINIQVKRKKLEDLSKKRLALTQKYSEYNLIENRKAIAIDVFNCNELINKLTNDKSEIENKIQKATVINPQTEESKKEIELQTTQLSLLNKKILNHQNQLEVLLKKQSELSEPLTEKYTDETFAIRQYLDELLIPFYTKILPKVVFWEYNSKYILKSETLFSDIMQKNELQEISRPLANIFLLGFGVRTLEEIKAKINEIQFDGNERSRFAQILNVKVNKYIKDVWSDYDQEINISLEQDQIRIEFFDPQNREKASYYNMEERSQGCQSFLSFLLTISAELKSGVIDNTILLLDEPETHLHPSGARFMLQELIKIAEKGNLVFYATHSIFLIDRENLDRHIILEKIKEETNIKYANVGRTGFFLQEEVIYKSLDVNLNTSFSNSKKYNFIFEGDGDVAIFEHFYSNELKEASRPFPLKSTMFYQGGKCSDIEKIFRSKCLHLTTKWIFIIDNDKPAKQLREFLVKTYSEYIGKNIYIIHYSVNDESDDCETEFEDLLPASFLQDTFKDSLKLNNVADDYIYDSNTCFHKNYQLLLTTMGDDDANSFKQNFKSKLNEKLKEKLQTLKNGKFKDSFPEYHDWVTSKVMEILKPSKSAEAIKEKK